jgi:N-acetylglucosaminyl-diphospho-decaprenol L-rhamnosyltransferase
VVPLAPLADVVVVSYNSARTLRDAVSTLAAENDIHVIVVDNASTDGSAGAVADLPVQVIALPQNRGFAAGCNCGWRVGSADVVLFLNPDARIDIESLRGLVAALRRDASAGLVAPRIEDENGRLEFSLRRFPRLRSTYARAFFRHRVFPRASWTDEVVREPDAYAEAGRAEWVSGACLMARRAVLEELGGWDETFFLYGEDVDLCRRVQNAGYTVRFEPAARSAHIGGASAPRARLLPLLAASRIRYARIHRGPAAAFIERVGVALGELTHAAFTTKGHATRTGHVKAFVVACSSRWKTATRLASGDSVQTTVEVGTPTD